MFMKLHEALVVSVEPSRWSSLFNKGLKTHWTDIPWAFFSKPNHLEGSTDTTNASWSFMKLHMDITSATSGQELHRAARQWTVIRLNTMWKWRVIQVKKLNISIPHWIKMSWYSSCCCCLVLLCSSAYSWETSWPEVTSAFLLYLLLPLSSQQLIIWPNQAHKQPWFMFLLPSLSLNVPHHLLHPHACLPVIVDCPFQFMPAAST